MTIEIDYIPSAEWAEFRNKTATDYIWHSLHRVIGDLIPLSAIHYSDTSITIDWRYFLSIMKAIRQFILSNKDDLEVIFTESARFQLSKNKSKSYGVSINIPNLSTSYVEEKLRLAGFKRHLTENQLANICKIGQLPGAATFSVPGAGKTTEALAYYAINSTPIDKLLIVAPKNAFGSWDEQIVACYGKETDKKIVRLRGGEDQISNILASNPQYMIITYEQISRVEYLINNLLSSYSVYMFLDESHRIKGGKTAKRAESILKLAHHPERKLIMSGTPMPQSSRDLISQFSFLYPSEPVDEETVTNKIQPIYVRTTKGQLGIPELKQIKHIVKMPYLQRQIYDSLKSEAKRQLNPAISDFSSAALRKIGKCVIKLMEFVSNPALLAGDMNYIFDQQIGSLLLSMDGPKVSYVCKRTRELVSKGNKVIIWSYFVPNIELLAMRLSDLGAVYIHGRVDAGEEDDLDSREGKINQFKNNPNCKVFIGNPAACSEGISLHKVCQYAIYLDRTFNAAQFIQSEDRIHRLGLSPDATPTIEIVECEESIDQVIDARLTNKINTMAEVLNDSSLRIEPEDIEETEEEIDVISKSDAMAIVDYFFPKEKNE